MDETIEVDVIAGYRAVGFILTSLSLLIDCLILFGTLKNANGRSVPSEMALFFVPFLLIGIALMLGVWRVRVPVQDQKIIVRRGFWPLISERSVEMSGDRRIRLSTTRSRSGTCVNADLELNAGLKRVGLIRNATRDTFPNIVRISETLKAPIYLATPSLLTPPKWLTEAITPPANSPLP